MYFMIGARLYLAILVGKLSRSFAAPTQERCNAVKPSMIYVKGRVQLGVCFIDPNALYPPGPCDSDLSGDFHDRKAARIYVFRMGDVADICCFREQKALATSTCEAEYASLSSVCKEAVWLPRLLSSTILEWKGALIVYSDIGCEIKCATNETINHRTKHIGIVCEYVRDVALCRERALD